MKEVQELRALIVKNSQDNPYKCSPQKGKQALIPSQPSPRWGDKLVVDKEVTEIEDLAYTTEERFDLRVIVSPIEPEDTQTVGASE